MPIPIEPEVESPVELLDGRNRFPSTDDRLAYETHGPNLPFLSQAGKTVVIYSNAAGSVLADIVNDEGAAIAGSSLTVDNNSQIPQFYGPVGAEVLYARLNGGTAYPIYAWLTDRYNEYDTQFEALQDADAALDARVDTLEAYDLAVESRLDGHDIADAALDTRIDGIVTGTGFVEQSSLMPSIKDFGAIGDGVADDTDSIQTAINSVRDSVRTGALNSFNVIRFPSGTYRITDTITSPPYVKWFLEGTVLIRSVGTHTAVHITPLADDPIPVFTLGFKENEINAPIFQGGGLALVGNGIPSGNIENVQGTGLEVGPRDATPGFNRPMGKYSIDNVHIAGFSVGLQLNSYNHYLGQFRNFHVEINEINVCYGNDAGVNDNSGENFHFEHCTFAGCNVNYWQKSPGPDFTYTACSFDYIDRVFHIDSTGYGNINLQGGHIEAITSSSDAPLYGDTTGGVVVTEGTVDNQTITLQNVTMLVSAKNALFQGTGLYLKGNIILRPADGLNATVDGFYAATEEVNAAELVNMGPIVHKATSRDHNILVDPSFALSTLGVVGSGGTVYGFDIDSGGVVAELVSGGFDGGKILRLTMDIASYFILTAKNFAVPQSLGDYYSGVLFETSASGVNLAGKVINQRIDASLAEGPFVPFDTTTLPPDVVQAVPALYRVDITTGSIPRGTVSGIKPSFLVSNPSGVPLVVDVHHLYFGR